MTLLPHPSSVVPWRGTEEDPQAGDPLRLPGMVLWDVGRCWQSVVMAVAQGPQSQECGCWQRGPESQMCDTAQT